APGLNGPFGAAIACGTLMGFSRDQHVHALGIAGSLGSGLLAFSQTLYPHADFASAGSEIRSPRVCCSTLRHE
ncbi:MAG: MmgE/PrpD family protein, partial [Flavobacteriales bacterium]|nr:MmgE/PrpD family protein [Flavobacteriales bacterium]